MTIKKAILAAMLAPLLFATGASALTIDFDDLDAGTPVTTIRGVTFSSNIPDFGLVVSSGSGTTSPPHYLGVADGGSELFFGGDEVTLSFADPIASLRASFASSPGTLGEAFSIFSGTDVALSGLLPDLILADGTEVFIVELIPATGFTSATLASVFGVLAFNIDDIVFEPAGAIPAPATVFLVLAGLAALCIRPKRRA